MENNIDKDTLSIPVIFQKVKDFEAGDTRFTKVVIWLMHMGENLNGSFFDRETVVRAIPTLANTPILGYIEEDDNGEEDFSDHRYKMESKDGRRKYVYKGSSYGVIPETNNARFQHRLCDDGIEREFLVVDGLVWNKLEGGIDILSRDVVKKQSMELDEKYDGYLREDGLFQFTNFKFYGACILGVDQTPAMTNSTVEIDFCTDIKRDIREKLEQFNNFTKGGLEVEDVVKESAIESFDGAEMVEAMVTPVEENVEENPVLEAVEEVSMPIEAPEVFEAETSTEDFAKDDKTKCEADEESQEEKSDEESDEKSDDEESEESVDEEKDEKIDHAVAEPEVEEAIDYETKFKELENQFTALQTNYEGLKVVADELQGFKDNVLKEKRIKEENELFEKYKTLDGISEFEALKEKANEFTAISELEKEIALVFVKNTDKVQTSFATQKEQNKYYFDQTKNAECKYGYLHGKYNK